ncbi:hypothetical protein H5410_053869 [Solanum commersonii]|uniref:Endonuclease/exonuclease/phosphatase domain-containing protein n=1 Tax=Solanum commersonii TaxID=4109 RepID=A0A9J5X5S8_SOLCO|nr:hypothetical protein H5410_053869 [Solanum commersonii]
MNGTPFLFEFNSKEEAEHILQGAWNRQGAMTDFSEWINDIEHIDPPLIGGYYTWRREDNHTTSKIDKFRHCSLWECLQIKQNQLPKLTSDHNPVMLVCGDWNFKKSYF